MKEEKENTSKQKENSILKKLLDDESEKTQGISTKKDNLKEVIVVFGSLFMITGIVVVASVTFLLSIIYISILFSLFYIFLIPFWLFMASILCSFYDRSEWAERCFITGFIVFGIYVTFIFIILTIQF